MNPADPSRRRLFRAAGATGLAVALPLRLHAQAKPGAYAFFTAREAIVGRNLKSPGPLA